MTRILAASLLLTAALASGEGVVVERAWSRTTAAGQETGAVFALVRNTGAAADRLLRAESPAAATVEVHELVPDAAGLLRMREVKAGLVIPAGTTVELKPRSYHIMLIGLKAPLTGAAPLELTCIFERAGRIAVTAQVKGAAAMSADDP